MNRCDTCKWFKAYDTPWVRTIGHEDVPGRPGICQSVTIEDMKGECRIEAPRDGWDAVWHDDGCVDWES
jgi:hypothetical protein